MRNATTFDDDLDFEGPARKSAARKPRGPGKKKKKGKRLNVDMTKVARYAAIGMTAAVGIGIIVNALMMQKGHHPAPLFGQSIALVEPAPAQKVVVPTKTARAEAAPTNTQPDETTAAIPVPPLKPRRDASPKTNGDDPIARLLKTGAPAAGEKNDAKTVLGVQQALVKLGYVLKPNGTFGPATKKAVELFEKDRHLPVKGELSHRLVKILGAESGVKID